jgi:mRNA interferase RelE/StbE
LTAGWRIDVRPPARRDLRRLDPPVRRRIIQALDGLIAELPVGDVRKLVGRPEFRLRVGDWRVLLELDDDDHNVIVLRVLPRGRAYD